MTHSSHFAIEMIWRILPSLDLSCYPEADQLAKALLQIMPHPQSARPPFRSLPSRRLRFSDSQWRRVRHRRCPYLLNF